MILLITLRHPGPLQAIASILPTLRTTFLNVVLVITDFALECAQNRFVKQIEGLSVYYYNCGRWKKTTVTHDTRIIQSGITEFERIEEKGFGQMIKDIEAILKKENPDIILRTTPAMKYGVDEAVGRAAAELDISSRMRCYQEIYDCGIDLGEMKTPVGVVDCKAAKRLQLQGIDSFVVGWMNQAVFETFGSYDLVRIQIRGRLGLDDKDQVILYCMVASGDVQSEMEHFRHFLKQIKSTCVRAYIRFHPRNSNEYRQNLLNMAEAEGAVIEVADYLSMEQVLAFPDYIVSAGSAMNLDALQYQILSGSIELKTLSIYTIDRETKAILYNIFGMETQPYMEEGMGSLILDGIGYIERITSVSEQERKQLYKEVNEMFCMPLAKVKERFLLYLLDKARLGGEG